MNPFDIRCQVIAGIALPEPTEFKVQIRIADREFETKDAPTTIKGASYNRWQETITDGERELRFPYLDIHDIGSVFIYLM